MTTRYPIRETSGNIMAIHERIADDDGKRFLWLGPDGTRGLNGIPVTALPLYGSAKLAKRAGQAVIVTEGEKATEALWRRGYLAAGTVTGAKAIPCDESLRVLLNRPVILWPDNDDVGMHHMRRIAERLHALGNKDVHLLKWCDAPDKGDAADFTDTDEELATLLDAAEPVPAVGDDGIDLIRIADVETRKLKWLWKGRIPLGKTSVIDGDPGLGKSLLTLDLAARVSRGTAMPDATKSDAGGPSGVVILSAEDDPADTIKPRLEAAGGDLRRIVLLAAVRDAKGECRAPHIGDLDALKIAIRNVDAALVVIDPLMAYISDERDSHRDQDIRRALGPLGTLANETGVAIVLVRHLNKTGNGNPIYRGGGSIGIIGAVRSGLLVASDPDDPDGQTRVLAQTKSNLSVPAASLRYRVIEAKAGVPSIEWLGSSTQSAISLLAATRETVEERTERDEATDWLRTTLAKGPFPAKQLLGDARQAGLAEKTLRRAAKSLGVLITKLSFKEGWTWALPASWDDSSKMATDPKMAKSRTVATFTENPSNESHNATEDAHASEDGHPKKETVDGHLREPDGQAWNGGRLSPHLKELTERGKRKWGHANGQH